MKIKFWCGILFILLIFSIVFLLNIDKKETVAVIGAMAVEIDEIQANISNPKYINKFDFKIITGTLGKYNIILSESGVGKTASASTTQFIIDNYHPKYIINIGLAGSLSPDLKSGDAIIAEKMIYHDFDVTAFGSPKGYTDNGIEPNKPTIFVSDKALIKKFEKNNSLKRVTIATGDIFVTDNILKQSI